MINIIWTAYIVAIINIEDPSSYKMIFICFNALFSIA
jgi:hypothetical protein